MNVNRNIQTDIGETKNVAAAHPDVVKALIAQMNTWAEALGAALSHQPVPAKHYTKPAPEGEVLEVSVTVTDKARPKDQLVVRSSSPTYRFEQSLRIT